MPTHLPDNLATQLTDLARGLSASKLVLFGSRARGDHRERSDIDLAVYFTPPVKDRRNKKRRNHYA